MTANAEQSVRFLDSIYGDDLGGGRISIWDSKSKRSGYHTDSTAAASDAQARAEEADVYFGVGLRVAGLDSTQRGRSDQVVSVPAFYAELDKTDGSTVLADDGALKSSPMRPSVVVASGHGLHLYWLLSEPWVLDDDEQRALAAHLLKSWVGLVGSLTTDGWKADPIGDLARVLRVPGTYNHKFSPPHPVQLLGADARARYHLERFQEVLPESSDLSPPEAAVAGPRITIRPGTGVPDTVMQLVIDDDQFRKLWRYKRTDFEAQDASRYDLAIADEGVYRSWSDQTIADAIYSWRRMHAKSISAATGKTVNEIISKGCRLDYLHRTISKARDGRAITIDPDGSSEGVNSDEDKRSKALHRLSANMQRKLLRITKTTGEWPLYCFDFEGNVTVKIESPAVLSSPSSCKARLLAHDILLPTPGRAWESFLRLVIDAQESSDTPDLERGAKIVSWLQQYLNDKIIYGGDRWSEGLLMGFPLVKDGCLHVKIDNMVEWLRNRRETISSKELIADLKASGFSTKALTIAQPRTSRHYYRASKKMTDDLLAGLTRKLLE